MVVTSSNRSEDTWLSTSKYYMGLSENRVNIPNEIAIFHRDNDQQNHWV